jgi:hypothetical protein
VRVCFVCVCVCVCVCLCVCVCVSRTALVRFFGSAVPVLAVWAELKHLKVLRRSLPHGSKLGNSQKVHGIEF